MNHLSLADSVLFSQDIAAQIASVNVNGATVDMQGWDGCLFLFNLGAMASGATFDARIVSDANSNMAAAANVANAVITQVANTGNTNAVAIDVYRPSQRYLRSATMPATANVTFSATVIRYRRGGVLPPTQSLAQLVKIQQN